MTSTAGTIEKAGSWKDWTEGIEKLYKRLDIVAQERTFTDSDKLFKLRNVMNRLDGEQERAIANQIEVIIDTSEKKVDEVYTQCWKFVDKTSAKHCALTNFTNLEI